MIHNLLTIVVLSLFALSLSIPIIVVVYFISNITVLYMMSPGHTSQENCGTNMLPSSST